MRASFQMAALCSCMGVSVGLDAFDFCRAAPDEWQEHRQVEQKGNPNTCGRNRSRHEDGETSLRYGERLAQGALKQRAKNECQDKGRQLEAELAHQKAQQAEQRHKSDVEARG